MLLSVCRIGTWSSFFITCPISQVLFTLRNITGDSTAGHEVLYSLDCLIDCERDIDLPGLFYMRFAAKSAISTHAHAMLS